MTRLGRTVATLTVAVVVLGASLSPLGAEVEAPASRHLTTDPSLDGSPLEPDALASGPGVEHLGPPIPWPKHDADQSAIVGGGPATTSEIPHQVAVLLFADFGGGPNLYRYCGGSIVSERVVMTAAHCTFYGSLRLLPSHLVALVGQSDLISETLDPGARLIPLTSIARHGGYSASTLRNDLAFLRLGGGGVDPSAFPPVATAEPGDESSYPPGSHALASGWGATGFSGGAWEYPDVLRSALVPIRTDATCTNAYKADGASQSGFHAATQICAGDGVVDSCFGDSGGPLTVEQAGAPLLVGVVSWGPANACAHPDLPGVYTEVAAYADMTDAHLGAPPFTDVSFGHPFLTEVFHLKAEGVLGGYPDGNYRSAAVVTRQAMSAFMYRLAGEPPSSPPGMPTFSDVGTGHPFFDEIEWMAAEGISTGHPNGQYLPAAPVTRQAMSAFMYRLAGEPAFSPPGVGTFSDVRTNHPFFREIEWMAHAGVTNGYPGGTYRPSSPVTRQSMAAFLYRLQPLLGP